MELTLDVQMDRLFVHGLRMIRKNEESILRHWQQFHKYLLRESKHTAETMERAIRLLRHYLFTEDLVEKEEECLLSLKDAWQEEIGLVDCNSFVLSMLESSIHRAIKDKESSQDAQAIQYVFSKINDYILTNPSSQVFSLDAILNTLIRSEQFSFIWIATIMEQEAQFVVEEWISQAGTGKSQYAEPSFYRLIERILADQKSNEPIYTFSIPFQQKTILFGTRDANTHALYKHINYLLDLFKLGKLTLEKIRTSQEWKDSVILFQDSLIRANSFHEALQIMTEGFVHYLPFERSAMFSYSKNDVGVGLSGIRFDSHAIKSITEDVRNLPEINKGLDLIRLFGKGMRFLQPLYIEDASKTFPTEYVEQFQLKSIVVAPIFNSSKNELLGAMFLDQGENSHFTISDHTYTALIKFGQLAGAVLGKFTNQLDSYTHSIRFSPRELEVLQLMAEGESTTSAAARLHLSEYTVRDYITSIMQKMKAKNRTEAVARAIRKGII